MKEVVFKLGDRVRLIGCIGKYVQIGEEGTIINIEDGEIVLVLWDEGLGDKKWWAKFNQVELI